MGSSWRFCYRAASGAPAGAAVVEMTLLLMLMTLRRAVDLCRGAADAVSVAYCLE